MGEAKNSVWENAEFDPEDGRVQYAHVIPDVTATLVTARLTRNGERMNLAMTYDRTGLSADLNAHVEETGAKDAKSGPYWEKEINEYLQACGK